MAAPMRAGYQRLLRKFVKLQLNRESIEKSRVLCLCAFYCTRNEVPVTKESTEISRKMSKTQKISTAMKLYLESARDAEKLLRTETEKYELGKKYLAKMMGQDPETFGPDEVDHPSYIMPQKLVAQFSLDGRPYHYLFYTGKPKLYEVLHFVTLGNALVQHVLAHKEKDFLMQYRDKVEVVKFRQDKSELMQEEGGRIFVAEKGSKKTSKARVKLYSVGTGKITINGDSILYFKDMPYREQVIFPLQFTGMLGCVDIVAKVEGGGLASQALALRLAISKCLANFVNDDMRPR
ncbi:hypothetical protein KUTeg_006792 [Tegillarca granosa]|uniref:Mitochondrial ribosomal protein S9 n=1 Tax=Tegillarca granosa TaxID=220873 RepID=A0ABQ9FDR6_TEGGR|nr:hypothetical protein KUTeg_006792 [Tegillarca granosa]